MKRIEFSKEKNRLLIQERGISFRVFERKILRNDILFIDKHPNPEKYPDQRVFVINIDNYVFAVPFVEDEEKIFLKTAYPSRKLTKKYLGGTSDEKKL